MKRVCWEIAWNRKKPGTYRLIIIVHSFKYQVGFIQKSLGKNKRKSTISLANFLSSNIKNDLHIRGLKLVSHGSIDIRWILKLLKNHPNQKRIMTLKTLCQEMIS